MIVATLILGTPAWLIPACVAAAVALALVVWSYWRASIKLSPKLVAGFFKIAAIVALAVCLLEPLFSGMRPRPGANLFVLIADDSRGLRIRDAHDHATRGEELKRQLSSDSAWQTRLATDFDLRRYAFDRRVHPVDDFDSLSFEGSGSVIFSSLSHVAKRLHGRPHAGILLFTDGNSSDEPTELAAIDQLPPIYPVVVGGTSELRDIRVAKVAVTQTNFESTPVTIATEIGVAGIEDESIVVQLLDEEDKELQRVTLKCSTQDDSLAHRFLFRPTVPGISFYKIRAFSAADESNLATPDRISEATFENNLRWAVVDRGGGPYRVLYVTGRPNWEFKFLRRALQEDDEVDLVGLVRIAKKEPKFTFRGRTGETTNPLFRGFGNQGDEEAEQYDQAVLLRLGTEDAEELRDGFPQASEELFRYHAIILDDVAAANFSQDQMSLIQEFVSQRGGGFLMLGGRESFAGGEYARTPIGELLPVYVDVPTVEPAENYNLMLTREGWLQPWVRVRSTEQSEQKRLDEMPGFKTVNRVRSIKPGASVLAHVKGQGDETYPALVVQRFGKGQAAALLIGDLWRWNLRRAEAGESDLEKSWRQTIRWLVADVPGRVSVETRCDASDPSAPTELVVTVRDEKYRSLDNATVEVKVMTPAATEVVLPAEPSVEKAGTYVAVFSSRMTGPHHAEVIVTAEDGSEIGRREAGWVSEPATEEFQQLTPDRKLLEDLAAKTGGEVIELEDLNSFVDSLPNRKIPITEPWVYPLWHQWTVFAFAMSCLVGEWGLRRWNGLP
ncbi:MAG: glutamine amidotransferase [Planctomycetota bacterium]|nr:glutamine amidotransferase [Planctomycetota bacterium]